MATGILGKLKRYVDNVISGGDHDGDDDSVRKW